MPHRASLAAPVLPPAPAGAATARSAGAAHSDALRSLDEPLPIHLTGSGHGWLGAYLRWPVFSPMWARLRLRPWGLGWLLLTGLLLAHLQLAPAMEGSRPMGAVAVVLAMAVWFGLPIVLGPWLAARVRRRRWRWRQELPALLLAFAATAGLTLAADHWLRPPVKQWLSRWIEGPGAPTTVVFIDFVLSQQVLDADWPQDPLQRKAQVEEKLADQRRAIDAASELYKPLLHAVWTGIYLLVLLWAAGIGGLPGLVRERRELAGLRRLQELAAAQAARREAETRLAVLQAQIEPHFLFNTLAGVRGAVDSDPARAQALIDRLVDYLRAAIPRLRRGGDAAEATLGPQLEVVHAYLALMATRLPRLRWHIDTEPGLEQATCPPMLLLTLVENAVKHGIEPKVGPGRITVTARREEAVAAAASPRLIVTVDDDGVGLAAAAAGVGVAPPAGGHGLGLVNLRERLQALYGTRAALSLTSRNEGGTTARLSLPLELRP